MKRKIAAFLAALSLLAANSQVVFAKEIPEEITEQIEEDISPRYISITKLTPSLTRSGRISCAVQTDGHDYSLTVSLQQYTDSGWETIDEWSENGNTYGTFSETYSPERGQKYRIRAHVRVYDDDGSLIETATKYSATV